jgi:hypothetical protein
VLLAAPALLGCAGAAVALAWRTFRRYELARPPIGVIGPGDVAIVLAAVLLAPYLYPTLPRWLVGGLLALAGASAIGRLARAVLRPPWLAWPAVSALLTNDVASALLLGGTHPVFPAMNDATLVPLVVAVAVRWAQGGLRARAAALLGGALALYELVATWLLPPGDDLLARLAGLPLAPVVAWRLDDGGWVGLGLADLLLAASFPLVMRRAYGRTAGLIAAVASIGAIGLALALFSPGGAMLPAAVLLGPAMVLQHLLWRRTSAERTTRQYLLAEPIPGR